MSHKCRTTDESSTKACSINIAKSEVKPEYITVHFVFTERNSSHVNFHTQKGGQNEGKEETTYCLPLFAERTERQTDRQTEIKKERKIDR